MPCHESWIQRWIALVRKALGWRAPTRRGGRILSRKRRERETRAAISADVTRFREEAEGAEEEPAQQGSPPWVRSQIRGDGVKSVVTEQRYRPAQQGSPPSPVEPSLESRRAANPERYGPVEHFVVTNGVWRRYFPEQKYRPAEHGSKPIPVHDARYYGEN